ncbi:MAG: hypothetical protein ACLGH0_01095 [Thermoanaerobaculia bacterium]
MERKLPLRDVCILAILVALFAWNAAACDIPGNNFNPGFRADSPAVGMLADHGLIFEDAKYRNCSGGDTNPKGGAYKALYDKIDATFNYNGGRHTDHIGTPNVLPYQGFLESGQVALIFATALLIGGHGDLDTPMDNQLIRVRNSFRYTPSAACGFFQPSGWVNGGDTCMEEHALAASAFAWIAAYEIKRRGPSASYTYEQQAKSWIDRALATYDGVCVSDPSDSVNYPISLTGRGPCNINTTSATALDANLTPGTDGKQKADVLSFNRNQNMVYGFGQMSVLSSALVGLEEAAATKTLTTAQQILATALLHEAQRKADANGWYFFGGEGSPVGGKCARVTIVNNALYRDDNSGCADGLARPRLWNMTSKLSTQGYSSVYERYVPWAYPLKTQLANRRYLNNVASWEPQTAVFAFNQVDTTLFTKNANDPYNNWGRESFYHVMGYKWHTLDPNRNVQNQWNPPVPNTNKRPRLWAYMDDYNPIGYLDSIDAAGVARGWACDQDRPFESIPVDFYANGFGTFLVRGWANQGSESAVNSLCGGGTAHRFAIQIPGGPQGRLIYAYGLDVTWRGFTNLPGWACANNPACIY